VSCRIGAALSQVKRDFIIGYGADDTLDTSESDWPEDLRTLAPHGVDLILDAVGGDTFGHSVDALTPLGRLVTYGAIGGEMPNFSVAKLFTLKTVTGISTLGWRSARPDAARADIRDTANYRGTTGSSSRSTAECGESA
jgi:NADPH2:quinone reductase